MHFGRSAINYRQLSNAQIQSRLQGLMAHPHPLVAFNILALTPLRNAGGLFERHLKHERLKPAPWKDRRTDQACDLVRRQFKGTVGFLLELSERSLSTRLSPLGLPAEVRPSLSTWRGIERQQIDGRTLCASVGGNPCRGSTGSHASNGCQRQQSSPKHRSDVGHGSAGSSTAP